ncbi:DNA-processing protein DprA [Natrialbaceae archaeon A-chndr2]
MNPETLAGLVALTEIDGIGDSRALELYRTFGEIDAILDSSQSAFAEFHYVDDDAYDRLRSLDETIEATRSRFERYRDDGIAVIGIEDDRYPPVLTHHHAPLVIFAIGDPDVLTRRSVSFSGSRETNDVGLTWTRETARELADDGYVVVSGGAEGADTAAHEGALKAGGETVVVLGTGVETPYPESNAPLFDEVVESGGAMISHRRPSAGPSRGGFLRRNRTLSALSAALVVVATDGSGGTASQYEDASRQDRQVFVPASTIGVQPCEGIAEIAADGATTVETAAEIGRWYEEADVRLPTEPDETVVGTVGGGQATLGEWSTSEDGGGRE